LPKWEKTILSLINTTCVKLGNIEIISRFRINEIIFTVIDHAGEIDMSIVYNVGATLKTPESLISVISKNMKNLQY
jgi:hypothetical protein